MGFKLFQIRPEVYKNTQQISLRHYLRNKNNNIREKLTPHTYCRHGGGGVMIWARFGMHHQNLIWSYFWRMAEQIFRVNLSQPRCNLQNISKWMLWNDVLIFIFALNPEQKDTVSLIIC